MKLLRVLQEREFERIGDPRTVKVDVRVIAATNADLARMVGDGSFREDLFYRLNVVPVLVPPLRERSEDIPLLAARFIDKLQPAGDGGSPVVVSQDAMRRLMACEWPGNVRQLENVIERALALGGGRRRIEVEDLPPELRDETAPVANAPRLAEGGVDLPRMILELERQLIDQALARTEGNRGAAARLLGLKRTTLVEKLRRL
jgi:transcriptional regulator with GAF, ATPase, and Fis domain